MYGSCFSRSTSMMGHHCSNDYVIVFMLRMCLVFIAGVSALAPRHVRRFGQHGSGALTTPCVDA